MQEPELTPEEQKAHEHFLKNRITVTAREFGPTIRNEVRDPEKLVKLRFDDPGRFSPRRCRRCAGIPMPLLSDDPGPSPCGYFGCACGICIGSDLPGAVACWEKTQVP